MTTKVQYASASVETLPGYDALVTDAARAIADRAQFKGGIGQHVYVNGWDLALVESAGLRDQRILDVLKARGWYTNTTDEPMGVWWFRHDDPTRAIHSLADAVLDCLSPVVADPPTPSAGLT